MPLRCASAALSQVEEKDILVPCRIRQGETSGILLAAVILFALQWANLIRFLTLDLAQGKVSGKGQGDVDQNAYRRVRD